MSNKSSTIVRSSGITNQLNRKELLKEKARLRMAKKRLDIEYRAKERILDKNRKRECRLDEEYRANEREKMKKRRLDEEYSANEKIMNKNQKRECRLDEEYRANKREKMREGRLDEEYSLKCHPMEKMVISKHFL